MIRRKKLPCVSPSKIDTSRLYAYCDLRDVSTTSGIRKPTDVLSSKDGLLRLHTLDHDDNTFEIYKDSRKVPNQYFKLSDKGILELRRDNGVRFVSRHGAQWLGLPVVLAPEPTPRGGDTWYVISTEALEEAKRVYGV